MRNSTCADVKMVRRPVGVDQNRGRRCRSRVAHCTQDALAQSQNTKHFPVHKRKNVVIDIHSVQEMV
jgi:hypothetical protein